MVRLDIIPKLIFVCLALSVLLSVALSAAPSAHASRDDVIEEVVTVGVQPGPKMWRVKKADHELWIFGTLSPIPKKMEWDSQSVEAILAESQEVIYAPAVAVTANPFKGIFALPMLWGIQNSPDKKKLVDLLPDELYQRWLALKTTYIGKDRGIEKHRPIFAANELFNKAIDKSGLEPGIRVDKEIKKLVKKYKVPTTLTTITRKLESPRTVLKKFKKSSIDDISCFRKTVERLEVDLDAMQARALAWSAGDVTALRALPHEDQNVSCIQAVLSSSFGADFADDAGLKNAEEQLKAMWVDAATTALDKNAVTFAVLPIAQILKTDGPLAYFRQHGYEVKSGGGE